MSSNAVLSYAGLADAGGRSGKSGTLLLDPKDINISDAPVGLFPQFDLFDLSLGIARNTVRRVLAAVVQGRSAGVPHPDLPQPPRRRPSKLDAYQETIQQLLARYPNLTGRRLHEELRTRGFTGAYTMVSQRLHELRPTQGPAPVVRFETAPGAQAQMDYSSYDLDFTEEGRRRVYLFSYLLGYSRRHDAEFDEQEHGRCRSLAAGTVAAAFPGIFWPSH
jgi:transposase